MSVSISIPIAAKTARPVAPASSASTASAPLTAAQLAKETVNQLQKQANAGSKPAARELQRREKLKQEQASQSQGSSEPADAQETDAPQEVGKGAQVDKTA